MGLVILALNAGGWGVFALAVVPHHFQFRGLGLGLGVALTAWTLGARHAFDADHISAIDNTTRKLMADGRAAARAPGSSSPSGTPRSSSPSAPGLAIAARAVFGAVVDPTSGYETLGGVIGTSMAATFLYLIAALNLVVLAGILQGLPRNAPGTVRRGGTGAPAAGPRPDVPVLRPVHALHHQDLAHVLRRNRLRDRLRHRHRGPAARRHRRGGHPGPAVVRGAVPAAAVRRRDDPVRHRSTGAS